MKVVRTFLYYFLGSLVIMSLIMLAIAITVGIMYLVVGVLVKLPFVVAIGVIIVIASISTGIIATLTE